MDKVLSNWIKNEKNKFSIFICGDYGVGKTYTVKKCLDTNKLEVYKLNTNSISDASSITKEYNRIIHEIETYSNINLYDEINNSDEYDISIESIKFIIYIDQNEYFSLLNDKTLIKTLILLNNNYMERMKKNKNNQELLLIFVCNDTENVYSSVEKYSDKIEIPYPDLKLKRYIFGIDINDKKCNDILNSSNNLNILRNELKILEINKLKEYRFNNNSTNYTFETKNYNFINTKLFDIIQNKKNLYNIKYLFNLNIDFKNIDNIIQEYFYIPLLESYDNIKNDKIKEKIKQIICKINKSIKLSNDFKSLIDNNQNWNLLKYIRVLNLCVVIHYIRLINSFSIINKPLIVYTNLNNKFIFYKKYKNYHNVLNLYYSNNENYHLMFVAYVLSLYKKYISTKQKNNIFAIVKYYNVDKFYNIGLIKKCFNLQNVNREHLYSFIKFITNKREPKISVN